MVTEKIEEEKKTLIWIINLIRFFWKIEAFGCSVVCRCMYGGCSVTVHFIVSCSLFSLFIALFLQQN